MQGTRASRSLRPLRRTTDTTPASAVMSTTIYFNLHTSLATYTHDDIVIHSLACIPQLMNITDFFEAEMFDEICDRKKSGFHLSIESNQAITLVLVY